MKLQRLRYFAAVYEQGSFSAAAEQVNATQSGLSMHVSQIEKRYGVLLFQRSSSGVTPTEAGRLFYAEAVKVLAAARHAEDRLQTLSKSVVGHINVGLMPTFTRSVLTSVLLRFADEYPEVRLSISEAYSGAIADEVAAGRLDFGVVPAAFELDDTLVATPMGEDLECLVCAADRVIPMRKDGVMLSDLSPLRLVLPGPGNARRHRIETYLAVNGIEVSELLELDTMHGTLDLVARSDWMSILPGVLCLPDLDGKRRKVVPLIDPPLMVNYMRIQTRKQPLGVAAQAFADILQEELNSALEIPPISAH
ncbi:Cyn operon transcriptional activator [Thalassovita gelatinovora]|uniref:Cyn operon transcriptional activator n=1 Tax=Thalassovita gelatinovora TaxID=53501 RepID=A0A0P1G3J9_THAGE|nr:LysR family transcriptional regulator [Thalassovita gelatinovora]QIZ81600.1 LysR family transcriptional regulator [Thalassovita gelatinovora]CUH68047.1 Cyn operon transcriptional activator [Thalassovita gelatinovora]SEQ28204.1 DNA-binding transcriptional regulator, LysR family [Thalassovita gelatinovora]